MARVGVQCGVCGKESLQAGAGSYWEGFPFRVRESKACKMLDDEANCQRATQVGRWGWAREA